MRRPILIPVLGILTGILTQYYYKTDVCFVTALLSGMAVYIGIRYSVTKKFGKAVVLAGLFVVFFAVGSIGTGCKTAEFENIAEKRGQVVSICGIVTEAKEKETGNKYNFCIDTKEIGKVLLTVYSEDKICYKSYIGKEMSTRATLEIPSSKRNPKTFDYRLYLKSRNITSIAYVQAEKIHIAEPMGNRFTVWGCGILNFLSEFKGEFNKKLLSYSDEQTAALTEGMLFGEVEHINEGVYEEFQKNSVSHILSVSGIHVALVYGFICSIFRNKRSKFTCGISLTALLVYAALSGFSPPVIRAGGMIVLHILSRILHKPYDLLSAACFTALATLCVNPYILFNLSFQLSYLAIISMAVITSFISQYYKGVFLSAVAVQIGMAPMIAYTFNYFSFVGIVANIPVIFISGAIIPLALALMLIYPFSNVLFGIGAVALEILCKIMTQINRWLYAGGELSFTVVSPSVTELVLYYGVLFFFLSETARIMILRKQHIQIVGCCLTIIMAASVSAYTLDDGFKEADIIFVDVGQGDCLHIKTEEGKNYLIDGGGNYKYDVGENVVAPYLLKNGVNKIDIAFVTHRHTDHYGGIISLAKMGMIEKLFFYDGNRVLIKKITAETGMSEEDILFGEKGNSLDLGKNVKLYILYPPSYDSDKYSNIMGEEGDENENSLIIKLNYDNLSVLMTGDIGTECEQKIVSAYKKNPGVLRSTFIKVPHHGSKYSSHDEFIKTVSPQIAVIQVGKNNFGHPHKTTFEKYKKQGIIIYTNELNGAIGISHIHNGEGRIVTMY